MTDNIKPLVYIILVNYKGVEHTIECIDSLKKITYSNYKIIVVDNDSGDNSIEILNQYKEDIILIESKENLGFSGGNNLGIKYAIDNDADYVLLLNNDTTVKEDFLDELVNKSKDDIGICIGKILFYYDKNMIWYAGGEINKYKGGTDTNAFELDRGQFDNDKFITFATGCCMLISKEVINRVGLLREDYFLYFEDTDYCSRILKHGFKIRYCYKSVIYHKESVSTVRGSFNNVYYFNRNRLYFIKNNLEGINKMYSYIYTIGFSLTKSILGKQSFKAVILAYWHFCQGITGKLSYK